jgi:hypothetical protein
MSEEIARFGELIPYLGQKGTAVESLFENETVHPGPQLLQQVFLAVEVDRLDRRKKRDVDLDLL